MTHHARTLAVALAMALALTLAGCGNPQSSTSESSTAANITFLTDPIGVQVWIDGENQGTTPRVIAVAAGTHEVELKRDGFASVKDSLAVEAGKDLTVKTALAITGDDEEGRFKTLLAAIGLKRHENLEGEDSTHRGPTGHGIMLCWPQRRVRREGLSTWRIEFGEDYEDDATLEFRKGGKVLHTVPLRATADVMEGALPPSVMEALRRGSKITWGAYFKARTKKDITAKFQVVDGKALERKLTKLKRRSVYRRAGAVERQLAQIELKRNYRFYTEALTDAMGVLNTWPKTVMADKVIVDSLQRLKLKDSMLYAAISQRVAGRASFNPRTGSKKKGGLGPVSGPLDPALVAPRVHGPSASPEASGGMKPSGMGVTPTGGDQKREPGPIEAPTAPQDAGGVAVDGGGTDQAADDRRVQVQALEEQLKALEATASETAEAEQRMGAANEAVAEAEHIAEVTKQGVTDAEQAVRDAEAAGSGVADAKQALDKAMQDAAKAQGHLKTTEAAKDELSQEARKIMEEHGSHEDGQAAIDELKNKIEETRSAGKPEPGRVPTDPALPALDDPLNPKTAGGPTPDEAEAARHMVKTDFENAQEQQKNATDEVKSTGLTLRAADAAFQVASKALDDAEQASPPDQAALDLAEANLSKAHEDRSRAAMASERAVGTLERTTDELNRSKDALENYDDEAAKNPEK